MVRADRQMQPQTLDEILPTANQPPKECGSVQVRGEAPPKVPIHCRPYLQHRTNARACVSQCLCLCLCFPSSQPQPTLSQTSLGKSMEASFQRKLPDGHRALAVAAQVRQEAYQSPACCPADRRTAPGRLMCVGPSNLHGVSDVQLCSQAAYFEETAKPLTRLCPFLFLGLCSPKRQP